MTPIIEGHFNTLLEAFHPFKGNDDSASIWWLSFPGEFLYPPWLVNESSPSPGRASFLLMVLIGSYASAVMMSNSALLRLGCTVESFRRTVVIDLGGN